MIDLAKRDDKGVTVVSAADARVGSRFGKYQLNVLLGRGGMGEVYEALDTEKDRTVALKILLTDYSTDEAYRNRFTREAHAAAKVQEPHVIPIHDWGEIDGHLYIDMRLVRGPDLRKLIGDRPLAPARAVHICTQVASALDAVHAEQLVHRDIKPENITVTAGDFAYLLDFGIAERPGDTHLTQAGMTVGSLAYLAPERLSGADATPAVDTYSLACVLYECLTGAKPFTGSSMANVMSAHLYAPPPSASAVNPAVPAELDAVIARGMAKEPDDRYGSTGAMMRAAQRALSSPTVAHPIPAPPSYPTMAAPVPAAQTVVRTTPAPASALLPPPAPPQQPTGSTDSPRWGLRIAIGAAVVLLAVIGLGAGLLLGQGSNSTTATSSPSMTAANPAPTSATTTTQRVSAVPPAIADPDGVGTSCAAGYSYPGQSGWGSRAVRGSVATTCLFTSNVLHAYWAAGPPSTAPRTISVAGARPCNSGDVQCDGDKFVMRCADVPAGWIECTGGTSAVVRLF